MILLIDGYNVLKMIFPKAQVDEHERERFITQLSQYALLSGNRPYIIFDGGEDARSVFTRKNGVMVIYSGYRDSADIVIKGILEEEQRSEVLLISTDRELNRYAENFDIPSMDSVVFYGYVRDRLRQHHEVSHRTVLRRPMNGNIKKFDTDNSSPELDALMESAAGKVMYKDEEACMVEDRHRPHAKKTVSKLDKRLEKVVKKL